MDRRRGEASRGVTAPQHGKEGEGTSQEDLLEMAAKRDDEFWDGQPSPSLGTSGHSGAVSSTSGGLNTPFYDPWAWNRQASDSQGPVSTGPQFHATSMPLHQGQAWELDQHLAWHVAHREAFPQAQSRSTLQAKGWGLAGGYAASGLGGQTPEHPSAPASIKDHGTQDHGPPVAQVMREVPADRSTSSTSSATVASMTAHRPQLAAEVSSNASPRNEEDGSSRRAGQGRKGKDMAKHLAGEKRRRVHRNDIFTELRNLMPSLGYRPTVNAILEGAKEAILAKLSKQKARTEHSQGAGSDKNNRFFLELMRSSRLVAILVLDRTMHILDASPSFCSLIHWLGQEQALRGRHLSTIMPPVDFYAVAQIHKSEPKRNPNQERGSPGQVEEIRPAVVVVR